MSAHRPTKPSKEQLQQLVAKRLSLTQMASHLSTTRTTVKKWLASFDLEPNPMSALELANDPERKQRMRELCTTQAHRDKISSALKSKWAGEYGSNQRNLKNTDAYKHALSNAVMQVVQTDAWRDKHLAAISTVEYKHNHTTAMSSQAYRDTVSAQWIKKYSDPSYLESRRAYWKTESYRKKISEAIKAKWLSEEFRATLINHRINMPSTMTKPHRKVADVLAAMGVEHIVEYSIGPYSFDIAVPSKKVLIEVNGNYWHTLPETITRDKAKSQFIQNNHSDWKLVVVWEHECSTGGLIESKLMEVLDADFQHVEYDFDSLDVRVATDNSLGTDFLYKWHYQSNGRAGIDYQVWFNDKLILVARFCAPHRTQIASSIGVQYSELLELTRFCIHPSYRKKNLATWAMSRILRLIAASMPHKLAIVSYADTTWGHVGTIYKASNWDYHGEVPASYHYVHVDSGKRIHKKTLWDHACKLHKSEPEFANEHGYIRVDGSIKHKYVMFLSRYRS